MATRSPLFHLFGIIFVLQWGAFGVQGRTNDGSLNNDELTAIIGDPISGATGEYFFKTTLIDLGGPLPLEFRFAYGSGAFTAFPNTLPDKFFSNHHQVMLFKQEASFFSPLDTVLVEFGMGREINFEGLNGDWSVDESERHQYQLQETTNYFYLTDPEFERLHVFKKIAPANGITRAFLIQIKDRNGNALTYTNPANIAQTGPTSVADDFGRSLTFTYTSVGGNAFLSAVTDHTGRQWSFQYENNPADNPNQVTLRSFTDPNGGVTTYRYDQNNRIISTEYPKGNIPYTQVYDADPLSGFVTSQTDALGNVTTITKVEGGTPGQGPTEIVQTHPDNTETRYFHNAGRTALTGIMDAKGHFIGVEPDATKIQVNSLTSRNGERLEMGYHPMSGKLQSFTNESGSTSTATVTPCPQSFKNPEDPNESVDVTFFDTTEVTHPDANKTKAPRDARGNLIQLVDRNGDATHYTYDEHGQLLTQTLETGGSITYTYDDRGNVLSTEDSDRGLTTYEYDVLNRLVSVANAGGSSLTYEYDALDQLTRVTDQRGVARRYDYDANGRVIREVRAEGTPQEQTYQYGFDALDRLISRTEPEGELTEFDYTFFSQISEIALPDTQKITLNYDATQLVAEITNPLGETLSVERSPTGQVTGITPPGRETSRITHTASGRVEAFTSASGGQSRATYDSLERLASVTDPLDRLETFIRDADGRITSILQPGIGETQFRYNALGEIEEIIDPENQPWSVGYTPLGNLAHLTDPDGRVWGYSLDATGRLRAIRYPDGTSEERQYDATGNLTKRLFPEAGMEEGFTYDVLGRLTATASVPVGIGYDQNDRVTTTTIHGETFTADHDAVSRLDSLDYAGQMTVTYTRDAVGRVTQVSEDLTNTTITLSYDPDGRLLGMTRSNGTTSSYNYDDAGRLTEIDHGNALGSLAFTYNAADEILSVLPSNLPIDPANLILADSTQTFGANASGEITSTGFTFDSRGRRTADATRAYTWHPANRLASVNGPGGPVTYDYTARGNLATRAHQGTTTQYFYHHAVTTSPILAEKEGAQFTRFYVHLPDGRLLATIELLPTPQIRFYHFNQIGSTLSLTDGAGAVTDSYAYDSFGNVLGRNGTSEQPFTYVGQFGVRHDPPTGLYHMRARYYDPSTAQFISKDPIHLSLIGQGGLETNPYHYVKQQPTNTIDPTGLISKRSVFNALKDFFREELPGHRSYGPGGRRREIERRAEREYRRLKERKLLQRLLDLDEVPDIDDLDQFGVGEPDRARRGPGRGRNKGRSSRGLPRGPGAPANIPAPKPEAPDPVNADAAPSDTASSTSQPQINLSAIIFEGAIRLQNGLEPFPLNPDPIEKKEEKDLDGQLPPDDNAGGGTEEENNAGGGDGDDDDEGGKGIEEQNSANSDDSDGNGTEKGCPPLPFKHTNGSQANKEAGKGSDAGTTPKTSNPSPKANRAGGGRILLHSGQELYDTTDMVLRGRDGSTPLEIKRRHLTRKNYQNSIFGPAWAFNYSQIIERQGDDLLFHSFGRTDTFVKVAENKWDGTEGRFDRVLFDPATNRYTTRFEHGNRLILQADPSHPNVAAHLVQILSANGNTISFEYETSVQQPDILQRRLLKITESYGRAVEFFYEDADFASGVSRIRDFSGREYLYDYNADGQLLSHQSPTVTSTGGLNDFPTGKTTKYTYRNHADPKLKNALTSVIFPNQSAAGNEPRMTWTYQEDDTQPFFGFVTAHAIGNANAPGDLAAGGTFTYQYTELAKKVFNLNTPITRTKVMDRRGTVTVYEMNRLGHVLKEEIESQGLRNNSPNKFVRSFARNKDGHVIGQVEPEGTTANFNFSDSPTSNRASQGNLTQQTYFPDARGAEQPSISSQTIFEPVFNGPFKVIDPRGNVTTYLWDYMEDLAASKAHFAPIMGLTEAELQALFDEAGIVDLAADVNADGLTDQHCGNIIRMNHPEVQRPAQANRIGLGPQENAFRLYHFNAFGQRSRDIDEEGNVTIYEYFGANDPDGNGIIDVPGADPLAGGYIRRVVADAVADPDRNSGQNPAPVQQETTFEYTAQGAFPENLRGLHTALIDGRRIKHLFLINELDQEVVTQTVADVSTAPEAGLTVLDYQLRTFYDANNNVVEKQLQNKDTLAADDDFIIHQNTYDILDQVVKTTGDVGNLEIVTTYEYDPSQNMVGMTRGDGAPEASTIQYIYDERDLMVSQTRGFGSPEASTITFKVDDNGNRLGFIDAVGGHESQTLYDGFNRMIEEIDRVGNRSTKTYDAASNLVSVKHFGPVNGEDARERLLSQTDFHYDERNRPFRTDRLLFHYAGHEVGPLDDGTLDPGDGKVSAITFYDRLSRKAGQVDAEDDLFQTHYDGLSRVIRTIDPSSNEVTSTYDQNNNLLTISEIEKSPLVATDEVFVTMFAYDSLDRRVLRTEPNGQQTQYAHDSRHNLIKSTDALGNESEFHYDRLNRLVETRKFLSANGLNANANNKDNAQVGGDGTVTMQQAFDDLDRIVARTDDNGNTTSYTFDDLDRQVRIDYADGTFETSTYNADGELITQRLQHNAIKTNSYDAASRLLQTDVALNAATVPLAGSVIQRYEYDGLDRKTLAMDDNGAGADVTCRYTYDSLSRQILETQAIDGHAEHDVERHWQGSLREVACVYPNGRVIERGFDENDRLSVLREGADDSLIASFDYIGGSTRDLRMSYGNGSVLDKRNAASTQSNTGADAGYDSNRRHVNHTWESNVGTMITSYANTYNATNRRLSEQRAHLSNHLDQYTFDSNYRMTAFSRNSGASNSTRSLDGADKTTAYLDEGAARNPVVDGVPAEAGVNQYSSFGGNAQSFSDSGSLNNDGTLTYTHDFHDRITEVRDATTDALIASYLYTADNRRVLKTVGATSTRFLYRDWQVLEERYGSDGSDGSDGVLRQYVDGRSLDEHIQLQDYTQAGDPVFFYHSNSQGFVGALSDDAGNVIEYYEYSWLGRPTILASDKTTVLASSAINNTYLFQGRRLDEETGHYYYRNRFYDPNKGEFLTQDPLGNWQHGQGNGYSAASEDPWNNEDPMGLDVFIVHRDENGGHAWIVVGDDPVKQGDREMGATFGFGPQDGQAWEYETGVVYGPDIRGLTDRDTTVGYHTYRYKATPEEEKALIEYIKARFALTGHNRKAVVDDFRNPTYNARNYNCRHWAHDIIALLLECQGKGEKVGANRFYGNYPDSDEYRYYSPEERDRIQTRNTIFLSNPNMTREEANAVMEDRARRASQSENLNLQNMDNRTPEQAKQDYEQQQQDVASTFIIMG